MMWSRNIVPGGVCQVSGPLAPGPDRLRLVTDAWEETSAVTTHGANTVFEQIPSFWG